MNDTSPKENNPKRKKNKLLLTLAEVMVVLVVAGLFIGVILSGEEILRISRLRAQISQIGHFDEAIADFHDKYEGLPGDLLAVQADREGMPYGNGTPSHSDGDGKISPCNLGWQYHLGCETALFWAQLAEAGLISGSFTADSRLADERLEDAKATLAPYLPESPIGEGIYITVWNSDEAQESPAPRLPYGNYFELARIDRIEKEKIREKADAISPRQAAMIDSKIDDGTPYRGRILVNGGTTWPDDIWGTFAKPGSHNCVSPDDKYNTDNYFIARLPVCHLAIAFNCCKKK
jgi:hypothetical protein